MPGTPDTLPGGPMKATLVEVESFVVSSSHIAVGVTVAIEDKLLRLFSTAIDAYEFYVLNGDDTLTCYIDGIEDLSYLFVKPVEEMRELWAELLRLVGIAQAAVVEVADRRTDEVLANAIAQASS